MTIPPAAKVNAQIREESAAWFVEFSEGDVSLESREAFALWLKASPEHVRAYLQVSATFNDLGRLGRRQTEDRQALIERALSESNVVSLSGSGAAGFEAQSVNAGVVARKRFRWSRMGWATAAAVAASLVVGFWLTLHSGSYATGIGEQRMVTLADGSIIELNAESRVRVHLTGRQRNVDLLEGQAIFHVAKDKARPFIVRSDIARVEAVGTQFDVNRLITNTVVTVLEGRVSVTSDKDGLQPMYVSAGEQVIYSDHAAFKLPHPDLAATTAWREHKLAFASSPLNQVVTEYNRYHEKRLVIADPAVGSIQINAVLSASDAHSLIAFLRAQPNIEVDEKDREILLRGK